MCLMNDFYPGAMTADWREMATLTKDTENTKPSKHSRNNWVAGSHLSLTPEQGRSRSSYSRHVTHEGSTVEKTVAPAGCPPTSPH
ncbi:Immunoglobulin lambda-like polypeptide 1 [Plecturocebus cupreus]